jgi:hypothetical protein
MDSNPGMQPPGWLDKRLDCERTCLADEPACRLAPLTVKSALATSDSTFDNLSFVVFDNRQYTIHRIYDSGRSSSRCAYR